MMGIHRLLICYDGSDNSIRAVRYAGKLASKFDVEATLLYVIPRDPIIINGNSYYHPRICSITEKQANENLFMPAKKELFGSGVRFDMKLMSGNPADVIIEEGNESSDVIIMGIRGMGALNRCSIGGVASKVSVHSKVPLLLIP